MNRKSWEIRALLSTMGANRATDYIKAFRLPEREEICVIEKEVNDLSYQQICDKHHFSPEVVKEARRRAFIKMADDMEYQSKKDRG